MAVDFKANQIRVNKVINSGSVNSPLLLYGTGSSTDQSGGFIASHFAGTGSDVWMFISGTQNSAGSANSYGTVAFKGDIVVSGVLQVGDNSFSPNTPTSGKGVIYARTSSLFFKDSSGAETNLLSGTSGGNSYWQSTTPNVIFTTGSARATFISASSGMSITGSSIFSGSIILTGSLHVGENNSSLLYVNSKLASNIIPDGDRTRNLGSSSARFANIYTGDLHLRNDRGDWTIVEEKDFLRVVNNATGKQYKMVLQPID